MGTCFLKGLVTLAYHWRRDRRSRSAAVREGAPHLRTSQAHASMQLLHASTRRQDDHHWRDPTTPGAGSLTYHVYPILSHTSLITHICVGIVSGIYEVL